MTVISPRHFTLGPVSISYRSCGHWCVRRTLSQLAFAASNKRQCCLCHAVTYAAPITVRTQLLTNVSQGYCLICRCQGP